MQRPQKGSFLKFNTHVRKVVSRKWNPVMGTFLSCANLCLRMEWRRRNGMG